MEFYGGSVGSINTHGGSLTVSDSIILEDSSGLYVYHTDLNVINDVIANDHAPNFWAIRCAYSGANIGGSILSAGKGLSTWYDSVVVIGGDIDADGEYGIEAESTSSVTVGGGVNAPNGAGVRAWNTSVVNITGEIHATPQVIKENTATVTYAPTLTGPDVCEIGATLYKSLDSALNAVTNGEIIRLLQNITYNDHLYLQNGITFTLDLNGKSLAVASGHDWGLWIGNSSDVTFAATGGGAFQCDWIEVGDGGKLHLPFSYTSSAGNAYIWCGDAGSSIIIDGNVTMTGSSPNVGATDGGSLTISGNVNVNSLVNNGNYAVYSRQDSSVVVSGNVTSNKNGVFANNNSTITISGSINAPLTYIEINPVPGTKPP
jgi:hypothetical protein